MDRSEFSEITSFVTVEERGYTERLLLEAREQIAAATVKWTALDSDLMAGTVEVSAAEPDIAEVEGVIDGLDLPIPREDVLVVAGGIIEGDSYGGLNLNVNGAADCTAGFSVRQNGGGSFGVATAGHCQNNHSLENGNSTTFVAEKNNGNHDAQWSLTPLDADLNKIRDGVSSTRNITGKIDRSQMNIGNPVCHYGRTTGYGCGLISSKTVQPSGHNATFIRVDLDASAQGDSGGPHFYGNTAYGLNHGFFAQDNDPVFMAQNYLATFSIHVLVS